MKFTAIISSNAVKLILKDPFSYHKHLGTFTFSSCDKWMITSPYDKLSVKYGKENNTLQIIFRSPFARFTRDRDYNTPESKCLLPNFISKAMCIKINSESYVFYH